MAKGDKSVLAMSVNDIKADENGNVALTAANVGADTAGAAQVVQGNLQAHIIDSVKHWTQAERDALAAALDSKAENTYGVLSAPDLLAWASMQRSGGSFTIDPSVTTAGLPKGGVWYAGQLEISNPGYGMRMTITETYTRMSYVNVTSDGIWQGWSRNATDADLANKMNRSGDTMSGNLVIKSSNPYTDSAWQTAGIGLLDVNGIRTGWLGVGGDSTGICDFWLANDKGDVSLRPSSGVARINGNPIATATKPAVYDLPLAAGMTANVHAKYYKNQFCEVCVCGRATVTYTTYPTLLATLPVGYRPAYVCNVSAGLSYGDSTAIGGVQIDPDGSVWLHSPISGIDGVTFFATFVASA